MVMLSQRPPDKTHLHVIATSSSEIIYDVNLDQCFDTHVSLCNLSEDEQVEIIEKYFPTMDRFKNLGETMSIKKFLTQIYLEIA